MSTLPIWLPEELSHHNIVVSIAFAYGMCPHDNTQLLHHDTTRGLLRCVSREWKRMVQEHSQRIYHQLHAKDQLRRLLPIVVRELPRFEEHIPWITHAQLLRYGMPINQVDLAHQFSKPATSKLYDRRIRHKWHIAAGVRWIHKHEGQQLCARLRVDYQTMRQSFVDLQPGSDTVNAYILNSRWNTRIHDKVNKYRHQWACIHNDLLLNMRQCAFPGCCEWVGVWKGSNNASRNVCRLHVRWRTVLGQLIRPSCWTVLSEERYEQQ